MKVDTGIGADLATAGARAARAEQAGYSGVWTAETKHDPFLPLVLAAEQTSRVDLGTSIAVAFARNPMLLANLGWDLQVHSRGRLILGLGSQIKAHITKRFSMPFDHPAARMRELVLATRAIWERWLDGTPLDFRGEHYTVTLMTPFFCPDPTEMQPYGPPRIFLAGVGPLMTEIAGEVADGFMCHGFMTEQYLREVTVPALRSGRAKIGKTLDDLEVVGSSFVVAGADEEQLAAAAEATRRQIAFYGSTPAYRAVLDLHGWGDTHERLHELSKRGKWVEMGELIGDDILEAMAVIGAPETIASQLVDRYGDVISRISLYAPYKMRPDQWQLIVRELLESGRDPRT